METSTTKKRRTLEGTVVRVSGNKTINVVVERLFRHPKVQRVVRRSRKFLVHDVDNRARAGDKVLIEESRPLSSRKRWTLRDVVQRTPEAALETETEDTSS